MTSKAAHRGGSAVASDSPIPAAGGEAYGPHGAVACANPLAAMAGIRTLAAGGNAVDAAVATAAALNVVEPNCSGLGGVGWMMIHEATTAHTHALDCLGPMPRDFRSPVPDGQRVHSGFASAVVPANLAGWAAALARFGTWTLARVLEPAIDLAEHGFPVSRRLSGDLLALAGQAAPGSDQPWLAGGRATPGGQVLRVPDLAATLRTLAAGGPEALYGGDLGDRVVAHVRAEGGFLSRQDLMDYRPVWIEPETAPAFGRTIHSMAPISLTALHIAEVRGLASLPAGEPEAIHLLCEAFKAACRHHAGEGATPAADAPIARLAEGLSAGDASPDPLLPHASESTTHLDVVDGQGNAVAFTTTIGGFWGCGAAVPGTGILLANILNWADIRGGWPQVPRSTVPPPCIVLGPEPGAVLAIGTPGGTGIPQTTLQVLAAHLGHGLPLQEALDRPRWRMASNLSESPAMRRWCADGDLLLESRVPFATLQALQQRAYAVRPIEPYSLIVGGFHAAGGRPRQRTFWAAADPRRGGAGLAW